MKRKPLASDRARYAAERIKPKEASTTPGTKTQETPLEVGLGFRAAMDEEGVQKKEEKRRRRQDMKDKIKIMSSVVTLKSHQGQCNVVKYA